MLHCIPTYSLSKLTLTPNKLASRLAAVLLLFFFIQLPAQEYGHEWIDFSRRHYKIPVFREGIYRIDSAALAQAYDLNTLDPRTLRVFLHGQEQFVFIHGENDGKFNQDDYLEFYAEPSSRKADSLIYHDINWVPNPYVPLFTDTIYAFLTTGASVKRYALETDTAWQAYPSAQFVYTEKLRAFNYHYNSVRQFADGTSDPRYTQAEGYGSLLQKGGSEYLAFVGTNVYTASSQPAILTVAFSGGSQQFNEPLDQHARVAYRDKNNMDVVLRDTMFKGFEGFQQRFVIDNTNLSSGSEFSLIAVANPGYTFNFSIVPHYLHLFYPTPLNLSGFQSLRFYADNHAGGPKAYYAFYGLPLANSQSFALYDLTDGKKITCVSDAGGLIKALIPNGTGSRKFFLVSDSLAIKVNTIKPAGNNGMFTDYFTQVQGSGRVYAMIHPPHLFSSATAYRDYRQSAQGGNFKVCLADIEQLYDQYCWGHTKHPLAVRNFIRRLSTQLPSPPENILLLGTATTPHAYPPKHKMNAVPTMGVPNSDNLLVSGLNTPNHFNFYPDIPIGRLAAQSDAEVNTYLSKLQEHESTGQVEWKKRVLHFVGGDNEVLSAQLSQYMAAYEHTIEDTAFGGLVKTFRKNSSAPIQVVLSDSIKMLVNNGASLLTFFGHGNQFGFDQSIDEPQLYQNKGRYPFLYANSCFSGDLHNPDATTVSKRFVFAQDKGSIGFLATTSVGFPFALHNYAEHFYRALSIEKYNLGIGAVIKEAATKNSLSGLPETNFVGLDMTLHGDPAVVIGNGTLPDYVLESKDVSFNTALRQDSLVISVITRNIGRAIRDSFLVTVERFYPNNDTATAVIRVPSPLFLDTVYLVMPIDAGKGAGLNYFRVRVDAASEIDETTEGNNGTGLIEYFVPGNDIIPVYPYNFAVVPRTNRIGLKASTVDPFAQETTYYFQLDTTDKFFSPLASTAITSRGGVIEWQVDLLQGDSVVYYWRVRRDSSSTAGVTSWRMSSFQCTGNDRGWAQAHSDQFKNNNYQFVTYRPDLRRFIFENRLNTINTRTGFHPWLPEPQMTYFFNNSQMDSWSCTFNGWNFAVFDSITGEPQKLVNPNYPSNSTGPHGNCYCDRGPNHFVYYFGKTNECGNPDLQWQSKVESFLNSIPPNNYVLGYTTGNPAGSPETSTYSNSLYQAFESIGSGNIRNVADTVPMIIFGRKGMNAGEASELIGSSRRSTLFKQDSIRTKWNSGYIVSPVIGPAYKWKSLHWQPGSLDASAGDSATLYVVGIKSDGRMDTLHSISQNIYDYYQLNDRVDATVYPFIQLVALVRDDIHRTPSQLRRWHVLYEEAPEAAFNPLRVQTIGRDSLQEGEQFAYVFPIENIGAEPFRDSLHIRYWIEDAGRNLTTIREHKKPAPFSAGEILYDSVTVNSLQLLGANALWMTFNNPQLPSYQYEQHYFNNITRFPFRVGADQTNPLLDVTFDGRRILNGDIVSSRPSILITLKDENKFLPLNDTAAFTIHIQRPGQPLAERLYFGKDLQFVPASLPKNSASVIYRPQLDADGQYTLTAQATDRSNNRSGANAYRIQFEVNNRPTVSNVLNYPNPFTTSTRFVFTLTGSEIPEVFTIRIMTVTGKVVREITRAELGNLYIGRNITEYAWDGRDQFGDRLANGVYLYKVITRLHGNRIEQAKSGADKYFKEEIGKMVLIR